MSVTMSSVSAVGEQSIAIPTDVVWRFNVDQYHSMIRMGILTEDDPVELLEGWLIVKMSKSPKHRVATHLIRQALEHSVPPGWYVDSQEPLTTTDSEPEPDVMIVRGETRQYLDHHPGPQDIALVVEVADSSLQRDRTLKKRLYASAGIAVYWIVNLSLSQIEVYTNPSGSSERPDYRQQQDYGLEDSIPLIVDGREIARCIVREMLP